MRAQQAKYRETNRAAILERRRAAYAAKPQGQAASNARHYEAHRADILAEKRAAYATKKAAAAQG